jgi:hypothetical protein
MRNNFYSQFGFQVYLNSLLTSPSVSERLLNELQSRVIMSDTSTHIRIQQNLPLATLTRVCLMPPLGSNIPLADNCLAQSSLLLKSPSDDSLLEKMRAEGREI